MIPAGLRKVAYASIALKGLFATVAPRLSARIAATMSLPGFENVGELEPTDWYVRAVRATGVGMLAAGGTALLLESRAEAADADDEDSTEATFDGIDRIDTDDDGDAADLSVDIDTDDETGDDETGDDTAADDATDRGAETADDEPDE
ncbi:hypothetical protein C475_12847 [Halosimplex carlsbadense 2-9-1]|uniref:DUF6199 domain-containing protein n=1 Tax=Halosimplex carlsbadense 2-9-1 TaxID=797114 RepID=M0CP14_9EURY|nr:hypothetical protein [Halosimplex carlsbadense]ELZ24137.1 hypothetical protein C475_12847 [Halosimplex carlsbadense 2-9-1]